MTTTPSRDLVINGFSGQTAVSLNWYTTQRHTNDEQP